MNSGREPNGIMNHDGRKREMPNPYSSGKKILVHRLSVGIRSAENNSPSKNARRKRIDSRAVETIPPSGPKEVIALGIVRGCFL